MPPGKRKPLPKHTGYSRNMSTVFYTTLVLNEPNVIIMKFNNKEIQGVPPKNATLGIGWGYFNKKDSTLFLIC